MSVHRGSCRCRAVTFEMHGPPKWIANCHCTDCRRSSGAPFSTYVCFPEEKVRITGPLATHESSPGAWRHFCPTCGTPVSFAGNRWPGERHFFVGVLDDAATFVPRVNVYMRDRLPWTPVDPGIRALDTAGA